MKKTLSLLAVLASLLLSACGSQANPATVPVVEQTTTQPTEAHDDMSTSAPPPATESATLPPAPQSDGKVPVAVTLGDNWVRSNLTTFKVGTVYAFTVTNTGNRTHNFNINRPAEKTTDGINKALAEALFSVPEDQLEPGSVVTFEYTFTEAAPKGTLEFACLIERHYKSGQFLAIVVEP